MYSGYEVVEMFEQSCAEYLGAPYVVAVSSCTAALKLSVQWCLDKRSPRHGIGVMCPKLTYVSVPMAIINAGGKPHFVDVEWLGMYRLEPLPVVDAARWFTSGMYLPGEFMCHSFHSTKTLADMAGGCIAHDSPEADEWFRRMRFHGRKDGVDPRDDLGIILGDDCRMHRDVACRLTAKLFRLPKHNEPLPNDDYPDLSKLECFR